VRSRRVTCSFEPSRLACDLDHGERRARAQRSRWTQRSSATIPKKSLALARHLHVLREFLAEVCRRRTKTATCAQVHSLHWAATTVSPWRKPHAVARIWNPDLARLFVTAVLNATLAKDLSN
jgi:hypothetical protein